MRVRETFAYLKNKDQVLKEYRENLQVEVLKLADQIDKKVLLKLLDLIKNV